MRVIIIDEYMWKGICQMQVSIRVYISIQTISLKVLMPYLKGPMKYLYVNYAT